MSLPFQVADLELRTMLQYSKHSLIDFMTLLHGFELYEPMQSKVLRRLDKGSRELLSIFREWGKSTSVEDLAVKELSFNEEAFVVIFGKSDDAAESRVGAIKRWFEMSNLPNKKLKGKPNPFRQLRPQKKGRQDKKYKWSGTDFILNNGNRCRGQGFMTSVLGIKEGDMRPTLIIIDDPTDPENPSDDAKMIKRLLQTITPLGSPITRIIITLTPRRYTDIGMTIMRDKDRVYNVHFYPVKDKDGNVTCPAFWLRRGSCCVDTENPRFKCAELKGKELIDMHILQRKREVKSIGWATEYELKPIDDGSSMFPMKTLLPCRLDNKEINWTFKLSRQEAHRANEYFRNKGVMPKRIPCVFGVDLAISESPDGDFSSTTILSCREDEPARILHAERARGVSFQDQKDRLYFLYLLFRPELVKVEINGWQIVFADDMGKYQALMPIDGHTTHTEKHATTIGIPGLRSVLESMGFEFPYGIDPGSGDPDEETRDYIDNLFHELHGMIYEQGKIVSITVNDDCGLSFWLAYMAAREVIENIIYFGDGVSFN